MQWTTPVVGNHRVVVGVVDEAGLGAAQGFTLTARANQAPTIRSIPTLTAVPGARYAYDVQASDPEGGVLGYALDAASLSKGIQIDPRGRLSWTPTLGQIGTHSITVTVTDNLGATAQQVYDLTVSADTEAPVVRLISTLNPADVGDQVSFQVRATDNRGVTGLQLTLDGSPLTLDRNGIATVTLNQAGTVNLVATATDAAGNQGQATLNLPVIDPTDNTAPIISLAAINGDQPLTTFTDIIGSVTDDNLLYYSLSIAPLGSTNFQEFYRATDTVSADLLGTLDPSLLLNDTYTVRLTAEDAGGNIVFVDEQVDITGNLKLGNFTLSFTDLEIPVSGIPISVTRTYDTLTANTRDDFGFGWRLEFRDTDLRTSLGTDQLYEEYGVRSLAFSEGERVYLTLPGGQRQGFTFQPRQVTEIDGQPLLYFAKFIYEPVFVTDEGVEVTLSVDQHYITRGQDGRFYGLQGQEYNPADDLFGGTYTLTTKEGIVYTIEGDSGDLLTAQDTNGNTLTFTEGGITSDTGVKVTFGRDAQGRITTVTDPEGNVIRYGYDALGDLVSVTDREGNTTQLDYNDQRSHYLDEIIDPLGRSGVRTEYGADGRMSRLIDVNGEAIELVYDTANSVQTVRDVFGYETTYVYDERGNVLTELDAVGQQIERSYDADDNVLSETVITDESGPEGWTTTYTYDAQGNQLSRTDPLGNTDYYTYNKLGDLLSSTNPLGNTTTYSFDQRGNVLSKTDAEGHTTTYTYDANGNALTIVEDENDITRFEYDAFGRRTLKVDALGNETRYTYDSRGNQLTETMTLTTPEGIQTLTTTRTYDANGNETSVLDAEGNLTQYEYDANSNQTAMVDALERRTETRYDDKNNLIETILPDDTPNDLTDNPRQSISYDAAGNRTSISDADGRTTTYSYDPLNRPTGMVLADDTPNDLTDNPRIVVEYDQAGRMTALVSEAGTRTEFEYDAAGRMIGNQVVQAGGGPATTSTFDANGNTLTQTDALGRTTRFEYDALGQRTATIYPDGSRMETAYDDAGNVMAETDALGRTTTFEYDALDRLTAVVDATGQRMSYAYDEMGNLVQQTDALGQVTQFEYDGLGRMVATVRPLGQRSEVEYDEVGRVVRTTDFNGDVITYAYNDLNQLISKQIVNEGITVEFSYSEGGKRESVTDVRGTTLYDYDGQGRLLSRTEPDGTPVAYTYTDAGQIETITAPSGVTTYAYTELNQLATVTAPNGDETTYTYDVVGNLTQTVRPNGTVQTYEYDALNRLTYLENTDSGGTVLSSYRYTYDAAGNKTSVEEHTGRRVEYRYDDLNRLTQEIITDPVEGNRTISYTFDGVGNRLTKDDSVDGLTTYAYDSNDRLLSETTNGVTTTYSYDANGNLLSEVSSEQQVVYTWSDENRLVGATITTAAGTQQVEYGYDADGIRVAKTVDGEETRYLIDANRQYAQVLEEYDATTGTEVAYVYGNELISQTRGTESDFYLSDGHSGVRQLTDETGAVTDSYLYDAYGNVLKKIGDTDNDYLYRGEQTDSETGLQYLRARYHDTDAGRFISTDPFEGMIEMPMSRHRYLYANDNPVSNTDPSGNITLSELLPSINTFNNILGTIGAISFGQRVAGIILNGTDKEIEWEGILTGGTANVTPVYSGGLFFAYLTSKEQGSFKGGESRLSGVWAIVVGGASVSVSSIDGTLGLLEMKSPRIVGVSLGALSGGFLSGAAAYVSGFGPDAVSMTMGLGYGVAVEASIGFDIGITALTGISVPVSRSLIDL